MEYTRLGRTRLEVSRLCLGTMNFGPYTSEEDSRAIMDRALALDINFFDTANTYGGEGQRGRTEEIVGRWLAQDESRRERVVLATKVYGNIGQRPNESRLSAYHIRAACEASLKRLQTDHIDLYQMHHIDRSAPWEEVWQAMELLVQQGKVIYVGSSNFAGWHIAQAQCAAQQRHFMGLVSEQSLYNLTERSVELEVVPACQHYGLGIIPWSPLAGGVLAGALQQPEKARRLQEREQQRFEKLRPQMEQYEAFCREKGEDPANVALAWLIRQPGVTAPIIGPRTLAQLEGAARAVEITFGEDELKRLDAIWPGPGGAAPEAYAW